MWEELCLNEDSEWVADCLQNNTLACVMDGSYIKKTAPDICSAGWVLACKSTNCYIAGTPVERSPWANSYRGELLGMLSIRLFLLSVEEYCEVSSSGTGTHCNCKGIITTFEKQTKRVSMGKQMERSSGYLLRTVQLRTRSKYNHFHVKGHQDSTKQFVNLSFETKRNTYCNRWVKDAITNYVFGISRSVGSILKDLERLPLQSARVFTGGIKQPINIAKSLRKGIGMERAKVFYAKESIFDNIMFELIS